MEDTARQSVKLTLEEQNVALTLHRNLLANRVAVFESQENLKKSQDLLVQYVQTLPEAHGVTGNFNLSFDDMSLIPV